MNKLVFAALALSIAGTSGCMAESTVKVKSDMRLSLRTHHDDYRQCYAEALERNADTKGDIVLEFDVKQGAKKARRVKVAESSVGDTTMENCVLRQAKRLRLPVKTPIAFSVRYPVQFRPKR